MERIQKNVNDLEELVVVNFGSLKAIVKESDEMLEDKIKQNLKEVQRDFNQKMDHIENKIKVLEVNFNQHYENLSKQNQCLNNNYQVLTEQYQALAARIDFLIQMSVSQNLIISQSKHLGQ